MPLLALEPAVIAFLTEYVASLEELDVLIRVMATPNRWWDAPAIAREFGMSVSSARTALDRFAARNLLDIRITGDLRYQFRPGTPELEQMLRAVDIAYQRAPGAVVQAVVGSAPRSIRDFADAFRIRRRDRR